MTPTTTLPVLVTSLKPVLFKFNLKKPFSVSPENLEDFDAVIFHIRDMNDGEMPVPNQALSNLLNFLSIFLKSIYANPVNFAFVWVPVTWDKVVKV